MLPTDVKQLFVIVTLNPADQQFGLVKVTLYTPLLIRDLLWSFVIVTKINSPFLLFIVNVCVPPLAKSYDALEDDTGSSAALADKGEDSIKQHTKAKSVNRLP